MFSVITHQEPSEASLTFLQLRKIVRSGGFLYFTAFLREIKAGFMELEPGQLGYKSAYSAQTLCLFVEQSGWRFRRSIRSKKPCSNQLLYARQYEVGMPLVSDTSGN